MGCRKYSLAAHRAASPSPWSVSLLSSTPKGAEESSTLGSPLGDFSLIRHEPCDPFNLFVQDSFLYILSLPSAYAVSIPLDTEN